MRVFIHSIFVTALLSAGACGVQDEFPEPLEPDSAEQLDEGDADAAPCRSALDCDHGGGERCQMDGPGMGICSIPADLDEPWMQMGPEGQPPPPFVDRLEGV